MLTQSHLVDPAINDSSLRLLDMTNHVIAVGSKGCHMALPPEQTPGTAT